MEHATIIGIDLAKRSFQLHGARADGSVAFRKKLSRDRLLEFVASHPPCIVAMEACASSHHWGREIGKLGHEVKLVPPIYVKPFVKRQKNDAADAEAICEAASRPTMRFVAVKTREQQAQGMLFRTRDLLVRQRTQTINALRGHFAEFGVVAPQGPAHVERLAEAIEDADSGLPGPVRELGALLFVQIAELDEKIAELEQEMRERARDGDPGLRAAAGELPARPGLLGLAGLGSPPELDRREAEARQDIEDGSARSPAAVGRRRDGNSRLGGAPRHEGPVAGPDVDAQAAHAGRGGAGQPEGAHRLGADDEERILPRAATDRLRRQERCGAVGNASRSDDGKGKRSARRGRENQRLRQCLRAHLDDLDSTRVSPYRPAADEMPQVMRPDTRQHLTARTAPSEGMSSFPETGRRRVCSERAYCAHGHPRLSTRFAGPLLRSGPFG